MKNKRLLRPFLILAFLVSVVACSSASPTPALTPTPDSASFYQQGLAYLDQGEYKLALQEFNRAAALDPNNSDIYASRGLAHHYLNAYGEAGADYGRAIELNPDNYLPYYNRGVSFDDREQHDRAVADYRRAVERNPDDPLSHNNLAWSLAYYLDTGYEEALEHAQRSVALSSEAYNQDTLALVYYKLKRYNEALEHYNQALSLAPDQLDSLKGRGDVFLALEDPQKARQDYQAYLDLAPEGPERTEIEAKLKALTGD